MPVAKPSKDVGHSSLLAARGLAALAVVFSNSLMINFPADDPSTHLQVASMRGPGPGAVAFFMVLSGLVMTRLLSGSPFWRFAASRLVRVMPMVWLALLLGLLTRLAPPGWREGLNLIVARDMLLPVSSGEALGFATMLSPALSFEKVSPQLWTMCADLLAIPLLACVARIPRPGLLMLFLLVVLLSFMLLITSGGLTSMLLVLLVAGGISWRLLPVAAPSPLALPLALLGLLWLARRSLYAACGCGDAGAPLEVWKDLPGALAVLWSIRAGALAALLDHPFLKFLGKISFSIYICHFALVASMAMLGNALGIGHLAGTVLSWPLVILCAHALWRWVEHPLLEMSKRVLAPG